LKQVWVQKSSKVVNKSTDFKYHWSFVEGKFSSFVFGVGLDVKKIKCAICAVALS